MQFIRRLAPPFSVLLALLLSSLAHASLITFTPDTPGPKPNSYPAAEDINVLFTDTVGPPGLVVADFTTASVGQALGVLHSTDASKLQIVLNTGVATDITLDFGNDNLLFTIAGDRAWLQVYLGATLAGTAFVVLNRDGIMNQSIGLSGLVFDNALFWYGDAAGGPSTGTMLVTGMVEVVDNIIITPEPASFMLLGIGLALLAARRGKAKRVCQAKLGWENSPMSVR